MGMILYTASQPARRKLRRKKKTEDVVFEWSQGEGKGRSLIA